MEKFISNERGSSVLPLKFHLEYNTEVSENSLLFDSFLIFLLEFVTW